jgi:rSAM/selenodomain-associated transferase 1
VNCVSLFLKAPVPGTVKTRLAEALGDDGALKAYRSMVEFLLKRLAGVTIHIHHTPEDPVPMIAWLGEGYACFPQKGSDLGERLIYAMELEFVRGAEKLIFLGGDCPYVDEGRINDAFIALEDHDVVLGPASDGGYYLIGVRHILPELFTGIAWGSDSVFRTTVEICRQLGFRYALLPKESDVDDLADWEKAKAFMENE